LKSPIPNVEFEQRLKATRVALVNSGFDALLAVSGYGERDGNVCYLCGHKNAFPYSMRSESISGLGYSAFLVPAEGPTTLISPLGYRPDLVVGVGNAKTGTNLAHELVDAIRESKLERAKLAVAGSDIIPVAYIGDLNRVYPELTVNYADELIVLQRMVKSENELKAIRQASRVADKALQAAVDSVKPGMKESAIGSVARKVAMEAGADYVVRDRVQSGSEIGTLRWPFASQKRVRNGELVSIDFVGWASAYGFDILRMASVGRPDKEQRTLIEAAGEATKAMTDALVDGGEIATSMAQLKRFKEEGYGVEPFGHAIGLEIVENPYLLPGASGNVKKGMVFCVEPELRKGKSWASIENEVIVTGAKPEVLTKLPVEFWH
jgi:Xaa-Pro aminopeptidase